MRSEFPFCFLCWLGSNPAECDRNFRFAFCVGWVRTLPNGSNPAECDRNFRFAFCVGRWVRTLPNAIGISVLLFVLAGHQEKGSACWGTLFCMLTCKMIVFHHNMVATYLRNAKQHVVTLCMLTCIRDFMHVNMHCCVCQHA